jgi:hypothetical protein
VLARELLRREDMGGGSTAEDGGAHRLDGERREEDPLARTQDDRVVLERSTYSRPKVMRRWVRRTVEGCAAARVPVVTIIKFGSYVIH